jgi:hypothetical protein
MVHARLPFGQQAAYVVAKLTTDNTHVSKRG